MMADPEVPETPDDEDRRRVSQDVCRTWFLRRRTTKTVVARLKMCVGRGS